MSRYVLKNKDTGDVLFVVVFTLLAKDQVDRDEVKKAESVQQSTNASADDLKQEKKSISSQAIEDPDDGVDRLVNG